jgi:hypothetical protein
MLKESLVLVIVLVIGYQLYLSYFCNNDVISVNKKIIKKVNKPHVQEQKQLRPSVQSFPQEKPMVYETPHTFEHPVLGKPDKIIPEGYLFIIRNPQPWNAIVFNQNKELKYMFILRIDINNSNKQRYLQTINQWKEIVPGINLNIESSELIVPAEDENVALAITNLLLNNLKGDLSLKNIIENNLIQISIMKIQHYTSVRTKIVEQIMENVNGQVPSMEGHTEENLEYEEDLAETINTVEEAKEKQIREVKNHDKYEPLAYEGTEFSFL